MKSRYLFTCLAVMGLTAISGWISTAQPIDFGDQISKLTAADGRAEDNFGSSVSITGNTAIVGAPLEDRTAPNVGAAYLYDVISGNQVFKLTAIDAAEADQFGGAVAINGNTAIVGARRVDEVANNAGAAYLFNVTTGKQVFKLTAADGEQADEFGCSVAIDEKRAIVGAYLNGHSGSDSGSAYIFDVTTGTQLRKLTATDASEGDRFGVSVEISGNIAIVGAVWDDDAGLNSGSAYLFDVATGIQLAKLTAEDADSTDYFGHSVAIDGDRALVGAFWDSEAGSRAGAAYIFDVTTGNQLYKLTADDALPGKLFGYSVSINNNLALVGARFGGDVGYAAGKAYLFDIATGEQLLELTPLDAEEFDYFGLSLALGADKAILGAPGDDDAGDGSGSAYLFDAFIDPSSVLPPQDAPAFSLTTTPNPFGSTADITFSLHETGFARVSVFDIQGRHIRTLLQGIQPAGHRSVNWDGYTDRGTRVSPGVYLLKLEIKPDIIRARKVIYKR